jgi:hypothetical protein
MGARSAHAVAAAEDGVCVAQLVRTAGDMFRLVPFIIIVIVPFAEFALPFLLRFFPNMLPSTYEHASARDAKQLRLLRVRLEMAKFFQDAIEGMGLQSRDPAVAARLPALLAQVAKRVRDSVREGCTTCQHRGVGERGCTMAPLCHCACACLGQVLGGLTGWGRAQMRESMRTGALDADRVLEFARLVGDELTLDNLSRPQLTSLCRFMGVTGTAEATLHMISGRSCP